MKWIKVFEDFESNEDKIEDLIQLCLVELTDKDFRVAISERNISISKIGVLERDKLFDYKTVKDHLITFVKLLSKDYEIDHIFFMGGWKKKSWLDKKMIILTGTQSNSRERKEVSVEDLVSDKVKINFEIISITVKIKR